MMVIDNQFEFGDIVYLKTDKDQLPRMVVRMSVKPGEILYCLAQGNSEYWAMDFEITKEVNVLLTTTG